MHFELKCAVGAEGSEDAFLIRFHKEFEKENALQILVIVYGRKIGGRKFRKNQEKQEKAGKTIEKPGKNEKPLRKLMKTIYFCKNH